MSRIKELEAKNVQLISELNYLLGEMERVDSLKHKMISLESQLEEAHKSNSRAWELYDKVSRERDTTRIAASEAIRLLQVENEQLRVSLRPPVYNHVIGPSC
jgi:hypothetical protein